MVGSNLKTPSILSYPIASYRIQSNSIRSKFEANSKQIQSKFEPNSTQIRSKFEGIWFGISEEVGDYLRGASGFRGRVCYTVYPLLRSGKIFTWGLTWRKLRIKARLRIIRCNWCSHKLAGIHDITSLKNVEKFAENEQTVKSYSAVMSFIGLSVDVC